MGKFNLVDEPWILVLEKESNDIKEVSLSEIFENTEKYMCLTGEMEVQNFAVMRMILAIIHTVFSRFDVDGNPLPGISVNDRYIQTKSIDEDDIDDYIEAVRENWFRLYSSKKFPRIITEYLEKQKDRFFLFDNENPFYQVNAEEMKVCTEKCTNPRPTTISGRNLNRTISESGNTRAMFSPLIEESDKNSAKDIMTEEELARWLITYQGYSGNSEKAKLTKDPSYGWLYNIGGIYLKGKDLFETLILNYIPVISVEEFIGHRQRPCWEKSGSENVDRICNEVFIDNYAELYTNWSRALFLDPGTDMSGPVVVDSIKLPRIAQSNKFLEPMTIWRYKDFKTGESRFVPQKHEAKKSLWRSFGAVTIPSSVSGEKNMRPIIFDQYELLVEADGSRWTDIAGVSLIDNGDPASRVPVDEACDSFQINDLVLTDENAGGWVIRINNAVEITKKAISEYELFFEKILEIRNVKKENVKVIADQETEKIYSQIDLNFKNWLASIELGDSKEEKIKSWDLYLKRILTAKAERSFENCSERDLKGVKINGKEKNIATEYNNFMSKLNSIL